MAKKRIIYEWLDSFVKQYPWWANIIELYFNDIRKSRAIWEVTYIKEKHWTISCEFSWDDKFMDIICDLEENSVSVCDQCWKRWKAREDLWWIRTLCKACHQKFLLSKNKKWTKK